jgi:hypothetical protein
MPELRTAIETQLSLLDEMIEHTKSKREIEDLKHWKTVINVWLTKLMDIDMVLQKTPQEILQTT